MDTVLLLIRLFLFAVFFLAGVGKLMDLAGAVKAVKGFGVPERAAVPIAYGLPIVELLIAFFFLFTSLSWIGAVGGFFLLLSFIVGMIYQISKGNAPDCHCFGQMHNEPVGISSLVRNIVFALLAGLLILSQPDYQGSAIGYTDTEVLQSLLLLSLAMIAVVGIFHLRMMLANQHTILKGMDLMEFAAGNVGQQVRDEAGDPTDGLPIGAPFPDFELADLNGKLVRFDHIFALGKPILFFFVGPQCGPCKELLPEIEAWSKEFADKISLVLISSGPVEVNKERYGSVAGTALLLQKDRELASLVHAKWTPTAIFVDSNGNVASHPAAGDTAVRDLVDKIRKDDPSREHVFFRVGTSRIREPKIGNSVPEFSLDLVAGGRLDQSFFSGTKTIAMFLSQNCPHCHDMVEDLRVWEANGAANIAKVVVFSNADLADLAEWNLSSPIAVDPKFSTGVKLGMQGTPSGVLVNEQGIVVSETAIGAPNIWSLIGRRK